MHSSLSSYTLSVPGWVYAHVQACYNDINDLECIHKIKTTWAHTGSCLQRIQITLSLCEPYNLHNSYKYVERLIPYYMLLLITYFHSLLLTHHSHIMSLVLVHKAFAYVPLFPCAQPVLAPLCLADLHDSVCTQVGGKSCIVCAATLTTAHTLHLLSARKHMSAVSWCTHMCCQLAHTHLLLAPAMLVWLHRDSSSPAPYKECETKSLHWLCAHSSCRVLCAPPARLMADGQSINGHFCNAVVLRSCSPVTGGRLQVL